MRRFCLDILSGNINHGVSGNATVDKGNEIVELDDGMLILVIGLPVCMAGAARIEIRILLRQLFLRNGNMDMAGVR